MITIPINNINNGSSYNTGNPANCQNIVIDNKLSNNTITISIDNITNAVNITINPNKEAVK